MSSRNGTGTKAGLIGCNSCLASSSLPSHANPKETAMAPHSSTLAWTIPWMEEPDRLQSVGLHS